MKIVNFIGGIGNQMFQYAFSLALQKAFVGEELKAYTGAFNGYGKHNGYELDSVFGIEMPRASSFEVARIAYPYIHYRLWQVGHHMLPQRASMFKEEVFGHFYSEVFQRKGDYFYDGYWQNENYFLTCRDELVKTFAPVDVDTRNLELSLKVSSSRSASIHVRRGDFLYNPVYEGICDIDFYQRAIGKLLAMVDVNEFFIFSNDISWCEKYIVPLLRGINSVVVNWNSGKSSIMDMYLMSHCHYNIISNSSFSWWGAWLNQHTDKIVVGPTRWNNLRKSEFHLNPSWIRI